MSLFLPQTNPKQSQRRDCSGSLKGKGRECCSPCWTPEGADEGGVPGKGPSAEGTHAVMEWLLCGSCQSLVYSACHGPGGKWPFPFYKTCQASSLMNPFRGHVTLLAKAEGSHQPQAGLKQGKLCFNWSAGAWTLRVTRLPFTPSLFVQYMKHLSTSFQSRCALQGH